MPKGEQIPKTSPAEIEHLIEQVQQTNLDPSAKEKIERLLRTVIFLINLLQRKNLSIRKLREMVFGPRTEKRKGQGADSGEKLEAKQEDVPDAAQSDDPKAIERDSSQSAGQAPKQGHGRRAAAAYPGARRVKCRSAQYRAGDRCPDRLCQGRLYDLEEPKVLHQFTGQPLIAATQFEREVLRCWSCQERYTAPLPEGVKEERYDATADATIALMKYGAGLPFYRQSGVQAMCGVPLGEATMWERCESVADAGLGVFLLLRRMAAGGEVIHTDDTRVRILSCLKEDEGKKKEERRATNTSGMVVKVGDRKIALYVSGRRHAGENLDELLKQRRAGVPKPIQMSDALAANWSGKEEVIAAKCLAHARRKVFELAELYPSECEVVLEAVGQVYKFEAQTAGMSAMDRLAYHQQHSGPVMAELKEWIERQFCERQVEPNSSLGKALQYWRNHWPELTTFLREVGAPLDNNPAEQALKRVVLSRKNSLFYKTEHGASVGDILQSLIESCRLNGINAWDYLVTVVRNKAAARRNPQMYLPWTYKREEAEPLAA
jgi:transposase